jgi:outer membrane receptor protein involved in Fe transport
VRAPNVIELFTARGFNLFDADFDPCSAPGRAAEGAGPVPASCVGAGAHQVTTAERDGGLLDSPAGQYNFLQGGNPNLEPESADTYTLGVVLTPSFLPRFNLSIDYYSIEVENLIGRIGPLNTLDACYTAGNALACSLIVRDGATGALWLNNGNVIDTNVNIGGRSTSGIDFNANYGVDLEDWGAANMGSLQFSFVGTLLQELGTDTGLGFVNSVYDCAGFYANQCDVPNPEWRHRGRVTWLTPWDIDVSGTWRYYGESEVAVLGPDGSLDNSPARIDKVLDDKNYFDLAAVWQVRDTVTLRAGVNNVFDSDPPLSTSVGTVGNGNTYPQLYDSNGRYFFFGITANF